MPVRRVVFQLVEQHELQVPPLARHFAQPVALLPALQTVRSCILLLLRVETLWIIRPRLQSSFEDVEHVWNVIVKLRPRQRVGGRQLRISIGGSAPRVQYRRPPLAQVRGDGIQLFVDDLCAGHFGEFRWRRTRDRMEPCIVGRRHDLR